MIRRRIALVVVAVLAVPVLQARPASAFDDVMCLNCTTEPTTLLNDAAVLLQWATQLERMTAQIRQQILIFQQLSGVTNVNSMATILNQARNFNAIKSYGNVPAMLQGGGFGNLAGVGQGYLTANTYFMPTAGSPMPLLNAVATVFNQRAGSLASVQAISSSLLTTSNTILTGLMTLQREIDAQPSAQKMAGINSRLSAYQGNISSQQYQLAQVQAFANAQQKVFDEKERQAVFCSAYGWTNDNPSLTGAAIGLAGAGNCRASAAAAGVPIAGVVGGVGTVGGTGGLATGGVVLAGATLPATGGLGTPTGGLATTGTTGVAGSGLVDNAEFDTPPATATSATTAGADATIATPATQYGTLSSPSFTNPNSGINVDNVDDYVDPTMNLSYDIPLTLDVNATQAGAGSNWTAPPVAPAAPQPTGPTINIPAEFDPTVNTPTDEGEIPDNISLGGADRRSVG